MARNMLIKLNKMLMTVFLLILLGWMPLARSAKSEQEVSKPHSILLQSPKKTSNNCKSLSECDSNSSLPQIASSLTISSNPAAVNIVTGTGALGRFLGIKSESGVRLGGLWIANSNGILSGGIGGQDWTGNNLLILDFSLDTQKMSLWQGGKFGVDFLQYNGQDTNTTAGTVQSFNSISASPPFDRTELYEAWFRQELFNKSLIIRIGKTVPSYDFNNVTRAIPVYQQVYNIPSVTSLLYTPIFVNSSLLSVLPGYYDSAYGITVSIVPNKTVYASLAAFDGNLARGVRTGTTGPHFNGYYFYISEIGFDWLGSSGHYPGTFAVGAWDQTGLLTGTNTSQKGTAGIYTFGSQRLWYRHPGIDDSGISGFFQYGINNSKTLEIDQYLGLGFTFFSLFHHADSLGVGAAIAWLNPKEFTRRVEVMLQAYYQVQIIKSIYFEPALTYIPKPGSVDGLKSTWTATMQLIALF